MTKIIRVLGHKLPKGWHKTITAYWVRVGLATPVRGQKRSFKMVIPLVLPAHLKSLFLRAAWRLARLEHDGLVCTQALYKTFCSHAKTKYLSRGWVPRVIAAWSAEGLVALVSQTLFVMLPADATVYHYQEPPHPYPHPEHPHHKHAGGAGAGAKGEEVVVKVVVEGVSKISLKELAFVCGAEDKVRTLRDEILATVLDDEGAKSAFDQTAFQLCGSEQGKRVPLGVESSVAEALVTWAVV